MGSIKQSQASKRQWAALTPVQRKLRMRSVGKKRWSKITIKKRREHARNMAIARWGNKEKTNAND